MSDLKTQRNDASVEAFLDAVESERKRADSETILALMREVTGEEPAMWGDSIVGFGSYHYKYASGREGEWFLTGFSPRKRTLTLYIMAGFKAYEPLLKRLGKFKTGKSCLYINSLEDVDREVLRELLARSVEHMRRSNA
ncbi:MAG: DUF1801 domain-containing protein [Anaerolineales bacterium]|jgi:hypothetical protein